MSIERRFAARALSVLVIAAWIMVPLLLAGLVTARSRRSVRTESPAAVWMPAAPVEAETSRTVIARIDREEPDPLLAPAWTGLVEAVSAHVGDPIRSGDPVVVIDGIDRIAVRTDRPFSRRLEPGDRGADVDQLNRWLTSIGHEAEDDDRFGSSTRRGVRALRRDLGVPDEIDDAGHPVDPDVFDPAWLVYLPHDDATVAAIMLQVGAPAPAPGMTITEFEPQISSVALIDAETAAPATGEPTSPDPSPATPDGSSEMSDTPDDGSPVGSPPPPPPVISGDRLTEAGDGAHLRASGRDLGPVDVDGSLPDETRSALVDLAGADASVSLQLIEKAPDGARMLAASALFNGPTGTLCVATRTRPQETPEVHPVLPVRTDLDRSLVVGAPDGEFEVQVNPPLEIRRRCRS